MFCTVVNLDPILFPSNKLQQKYAGFFQYTTSYVRLQCGYLRR